MNTMLDTTSFSLGGQYLMSILVILGGVMGISGAVNLVRSRPVWEHPTVWVFATVNLVFIAGFFWICWFHYQIYLTLPLDLPDNLVAWLNNHLEAMNRQSPLVKPRMPLRAGASRPAPTILAAARARSIEPSPVRRVDEGSNQHQAEAIAVRRTRKGHLKRRAPSGPQRPTWCSSFGQAVGRDHCASFT